MKLFHLSTVLTETGLYEVEVIINVKKYLYFLNSQFKVEMFNHLYKRKTTHGKALAYLNQHNLKGTGKEYVLTKRSESYRRSETQTQPN